MWIIQTRRWLLLSPLPVACPLPIRGDHQLLLDPAGPGDGEGRSEGNGISVWHSPPGWTGFQEPLNSFLRSTLFPWNNWADTGVFSSPLFPAFRTPSALLDLVSPPVIHMGVSKFPFFCFDGHHDKRSLLRPGFVSSYTLKIKTHHRGQSGQKLKEGTKVEAMEEHCLLACSLWVTHPAFSYNPGLLA